MNRFLPPVAYCVQAFLGYLAYLFFFLQAFMGGIFSQRAMWRVCVAVLGAFVFTALWVRFFRLCPIRLALSYSAVSIIVAIWSATRVDFTALVFHFALALALCAAALLGGWLAQKGTKDSQ